MNEIVSKLPEEERIEIARTTKSPEIINVLSSDSSKAVINTLIDNPSVNCDVLFDIAYFNVGEIRDNAKAKLMERIKARLSEDNYMLLYFASKCFYWHYIEHRLPSGMTIPNFLLGEMVNRVLASVCAFNALYNRNLYGDVNFIRKVMKKKGNNYDFKIMSYYRFFPEELEDIAIKAQLPEDFIRDVDEFANLMN